MDYVVFQYIHQWVGRSSALDGFMIFLAQWLTPLYVVVLALVGLEALRRTRTLSLALAALMAGAAAWIMQAGVAELLFFPRPFTLLDFTPLVNHDPWDASFPSGHTSFVFGIAWYVFLTEPKKIKGAGALCMAFVIGFARVYAGVHWPLDIVGGIFIGLLAACLMHMSLTYVNATRRHREYKMRRA